MEQRSELRVPCDEAVVVTVLREPEARYPARIRNSSTRGMAIQIPAEVSPGTALKIEWNDSLVLGEAVYCHPEGDAYLVGIDLDQVLCGLAELGRRLSSFAPPGQCVML